MQFFFARGLYKSLNVPIGMLNAPWTGTRAQSWVPKAALDADPQFATASADWDKNVEFNFAVQLQARDRLTAWKTAAALAVEAGQEPPPKPPEIIEPNSPHTPGILFHSMIEPLVPFAIRGIIWYQGESDSWRPADDYRDIFQLLINEWRNAWEEPELPFLFVQLPNYRPEDPHNLNNWAEMRQAQAEALALPATGMVVTIDVGAPDDIHPPNKLPVGERLVLQAKSLVYGLDVVANGPSPVRAQSIDGRVVLEFENADGLATTDDRAPVGFEVAGEASEWVEATAEIEGHTVRVVSPDIAAPTRVRYAWKNYPEPTPNLVNGAGLPAGPFELQLIE